MKENHTLNQQRQFFLVRAGGMMGCIAAIYNRQGFKLTPSLYHHPNFSNTGFVDTICRSKPNSLGLTPKAKAIN